MPLLSIGQIPNSFFILCLFGLLLSCSDGDITLFNDKSEGWRGREHGWMPGYYGQNEVLWNEMRNKIVKNTSAIIT